MADYYDEENYVSIWIGDCPNEDTFNDYISLRPAADDECAFYLGEDFGIIYYDDSFTLVNFINEPTNDLRALLDTGVPDSFIDELVNKYGDKLKETYNCCFMILDMHYTGAVKEFNNSKYGNFLFLGCVEADKCDLL